MPVLENGETRIRYEEYGDGFPVLLLAPGGLRSTIEFWDVAPWHPVTELAGRHRLVAMDQRNAGESFAPVRASDGWDVYADDQLALLDHLGVERCHVLGMCIGGSFIASLLTRAPERFAAAVALQPIGFDANRDAFRSRFDEFADEERPNHPEAGDDDWRGLRENLFGAADDHTLFSVPDDALATIEHPLLVAMGGDEPHPERASRTLAERPPNATLMERWKAEEYRAAGLEKVRDFLTVHVPR